MEKLRARDTSFRFGSFADNLDPAPPHLRPSPSPSLSLVFSLSVPLSAREACKNSASLHREEICKTGRPSGTRHVRRCISCFLASLFWLARRSQMRWPEKLWFRGCLCGTVTEIWFRGKRFVGWSNEYRIVETDITRANWIFKLWSSRDAFL